MNSVEHFVGLDDHQDSVQVCVMDPLANVRLNRSGPNHAASLAALLREVERGGGPVRRIALEACTGAADLAGALADAGAGGGGWG